MRDVTITFTLREKQEERLKRITEEYKNKYGLEMTEERMFTTIMLPIPRPPSNGNLKREPLPIWAVISLI